MSMRMNGYEQQMVNKWMRTMSRRDAEDCLRELRMEQNGDEYQQLRPVKYAPGVKQEMKREKAKAAAAKTVVTDPEHPILRKYLPFGTDVGALSKAEHQAMKSEMACTYDIPVMILDISSLEIEETKIKIFKERISRKNREAYELLTRKKTRLTGLYKLLGDDIYEMFWSPYQLVAYAIECQEA